MDYIYARLDNNLVDVNRIDKILLLKCEINGEPLSDLKIGDYYLKITIVESNKVSYCNLASLNLDSEALSIKIENESTRAKGVELEINNRLLEEISRAQQKESDIETSLENKIVETNVEIESVKAGLNEEKETRNTQITEEIDRAKGAEKALDEKINEKSANFEEKIDSLENTLTEKENALNTKIDAEINRSKEAENALRTDIDSLDNKLDVEIADREANVNELHKMLSDETTERKETDNSLGVKIEAEISRATTNENKINEKISKIEEILDPGDSNSMASLLFDEI